jgi:hypothetical protein
MLQSDRSRPSGYAEDLGANKELMGMYRDPSTFVRFEPEAPVIAASDMIYSASTQDRFKFTDAEVTAHQDHYLRNAMRLLQENEIPVAVLNVPQYSERTNDKIVERFDWSAKFGRPIPLIGVAPTKLFAGLDEKQVELLHCDREHFNKNGNEYFTKSILPALLVTYRDHASQAF